MAKIKCASKNHSQVPRINTSSKDKLNKVQTRKKGKKERIYTTEALKRALNSIGEGKTIRSAASMFGVPKSTLHAKARYYIPIEVRKGPTSILTAEEEKNIVDWIIECGQRGFPVSKEHLLNCVQEFVKKTKRVTPFKNGRPGKYWYYAFMKRHPILSNRTAQNLTSPRAAISEEELRVWFTKIESYLASKDLLNIEGSRIFNADESSFMLEPKQNKVIFKRGSRSVYKIIGYNEKATLTVLFNASASGELAPPCVLYSLKKPPSKKSLKLIDKTWGIGYTNKGWMTEDSFNDYIMNVFYPWLVKKGITFPVLFYLDNHASHVNLPLLKFCKEKKIELLALYPNSTHILQPLDVAFFHPLKDAYKKCINTYKVEKRTLDVKKDAFPSILQKALGSINLKDIIINGFEACGLHPFNPNAVVYNVLNKPKKGKDNMEVPEVESEEHPYDEQFQDSYAKFLVIFEKELIDPEILLQFQSQELDGTWHGNKEYEELFKSWMKLKNLCTNMQCAESISHGGYINQTFENELHQNNVVRDDQTTESIDLNNCNEYEGLGDIQFVGENGKTFTAQIIAVGDWMDSSDFLKQIDSGPHENIKNNDTLQSGESFDTLEDVNIYKNETVNNTSFTEDSSNTILSQDLSNISDHSNHDELNTSPLHVIEEIDSQGISSSSITCSTALANTTEESSIFNFSGLTIENSLLDNVLDLSVKSSNNNKVLYPIENISSKSSTLSNSENANSHGNSSNSTENLTTFDSVFRRPTKEVKGRKKEGKKQPTVFVADELLQVYQNKENEKILKEKKAQLIKEEKQKNKLLKEKEGNFIKSSREKRQSLVKNKKTILQEIKNLKAMLKSVDQEQNLILLREKLEKSSQELKEVESAITFHDMEVLQQKLKIKEEKVELST